MAISTQWQLARQAAERYEQILVPAILGPAARALVDRADVQTGETVLDVGCGTSAAARGAAERAGPAGRVIGVDVNAGMLDVARALPAVSGAAIEWYEHSAYQLPLDDGLVDVVLCAQTLQFLDDRPRALSEMRRVLKPGGRLAASLWCDIRENPYFDALVEAMARHVGRETAAGLSAAFGLSGAGEIRRLLAGAGFRRVDVSVARLDLALPEPGEFVPRQVRATPMAPGFRAAAPEAQQAVIQEVAGRLAPYQANGGVRVPFRTHVAMAVR